MDRESNGSQTNKPRKGAKTREIIPGPLRHLNLIKLDAHEDREDEMQSETFQLKSVGSQRDKEWLCFGEAKIDKMDAAGLEHQSSAGLR